MNSGENKKGQKKFIRPKEQEMETLSCFTCKKKITCSCCLPVGSDKTRRVYACSMTDEYPKSSFSQEDGRIHLCSSECKDKWMKVISDRRNSKF